MRTIGVTTASHPIALGKKPGEFCGNLKLNPHTTCLTIPAHFPNHCHKSLFYALWLCWIKNTHQATFALCLSLKYHLQVKWTVYSTFASVMYIPAPCSVSLLRSSSVGSGWALTKAQHSSHRFNSCSPQPLSTYSSLHPLFFSFQCLSLHYYCSSASLACVLSCLAPPHPSPSTHPELATCLLSFSFVWVVLWMYVKKGA